MKEKQQTKEIIDENYFRAAFYCFRPAGNDTALVLSDISDQAVKKQINDGVMKIYSNVEQVGFVYGKDYQLTMDMAGDELCVNASRCATYLAMDGNPGDTSIKVSGASELLKSGINNDGEVYIQLPINSESNKVSRDSSSSSWIVQMEGITHYVDFDMDQIKGLSPEDIKRLALSKIKEKNLDLFAASGVIFTKKTKEGYRIVPIVYVRNIDTLFLETACGSGTCALGQVLAICNQQPIIDLPIIQPSGKSINVSVSFKNNSITDVTVKSKVEKLFQGVLRTDKDGQYYSVEKITTESFDDPLIRDQLIQMYQSIFGEEPYFEVFAPDEILGYFKKFLEKGTVLVAKNAEGVIGFAASLPLNAEDEVKNNAEQNGIESKKCGYIAELAVAKTMRRKRIGQGLMEELLMNVPDQYILLRTNEDNVPAIKLYEKLGFSKVISMKESVTRERVGGETLEDQRIFMIKCL